MQIFAGETVEVRHAIACSPCPLPQGEACSPGRGGEGNLQRSDSTRTARFETHPADGFLPKPVCRPDRNQEARLIAPTFHKVAADFAGRFQITKLAGSLPW